MRSHRLPAVLIAALLPVASFAVPVTWEFTGQISGAAGRSPPDGGEFVPFVPFGTEFVATFTWDSNALPAYDSEGWRVYLNPVTAASVSLGSGGSLGVFNFSARADDSEASRISLLNDLSFGGTLPFDELDIMASLGNHAGDPTNMRRWMSFGTWDPTALQLTGEETLLDPFYLSESGFHQFTFGYSLWDEAGMPIDQGSVDSQQVSARQVTSVPEPGTWSMFVAALAGVWFVSRRRISPCAARGP